MIPLTIVKVGGSLFDHPRLGPGLRHWTAQRSPFRMLLVPGGGALADVIRDYHRAHRVPEEVCHWMAIKAMGLNASFIKSLLLNANDIDDPLSWPAVCGLGVLNAHHFMLADESQAGALGHDWQVTSDAIAARVAEVGGWRRIVMLKSVDLPAGISWKRAAAEGFVDPVFGDVVERATLSVEWVNFRQFLDGFSLVAGSLR